MKIFIALFSFVFLMPPLIGEYADKCCGCGVEIGFAQPYETAGPPENNGQKSLYVAKCPDNGLTNDIVRCTDCHALKGWVLKEIWPDDRLKHPDWIVERKGEKHGYYYLTAITSDRMAEFFDYMREHKIKHVRVEIFSPGGGLFEAWRIKGLFELWEHEGGIVETRLLGPALSAGCLVLISGTPGHRFVSETAEIMWHELKGWGQSGIKTPSDEEESARVYRHLQDTLNAWIAKRTNMTKKDIDQKVSHREFWINGKQAVELGFADGFLKDATTISDTQDSIPIDEDFVTDKRTE